MNTHVTQHRHLVLLIIGITAALFAVAAFARIVGWMPKVSAGFAQILASNKLVAVWAAPLAAIAHTTASDARANARCAECGVIQSIQVMDAQDDDIGSAPTADKPGNRSTRSRQITIRMSDGSTRVIHDAYSAGWRPRERVIVMGGLSSNR